MDLKTIYDSPTDELKEKANACKTKEDQIAFADEKGIELTDEALDAVAGGGGCPPHHPFPWY